MLSYKKYKEIYKTSTLGKYIKNYVLYKPRKWCRIPYCTYMCLKYPFLYPRNRFTNLHYNNWKIIEFKDKLYKNYHKCKFQNSLNPAQFEKYKRDVFDKTDKWYIYNGENTRLIEWWTNWWSMPLYYIVKFFHNYILQIFHCLPTYTEWDAVEKGWNKAFGKQYLNDLKKQLKKDKMLYSWRIMDIKEKFGCLNLYYNYGSEELYSLISVYENLSWNTCINCGKPATHNSKGWIRPYCADCAKTIGGYGCIERGTEEEEEYEIANF
jgi:hypothetical protein